MNKIKRIALWTAGAALVVAGRAVFAFVDSFFGAAGTDLWDLVRDSVQNALIR